MKKNAQHPKKLLALSQETVKKLNDDSLQNVVGGTSSCLPPPLPKS